MNSLIDGSQYLVAGLCIAVLFTGIVFLIVVATWRKNENSYRAANLYLFSFFLVVCLQMLEIISFQLEFIHSVPHMVNLFDAYVALAPFLIYAYIREINGFPVDRLGTILPHLTPAIIIVLLNIPVWMLTAEDKVTFALQNYYLEQHRFVNYAPSADENMFYVGLLTLLYWWKLGGYLEKSRRTKGTIKRLSENIRLLVLFNAFVLIGLGLAWSIPGTYLALLGMFIVDTGYVLYYFLNQVQLPKSITTIPAKPSTQIPAKNQISDDVLSAYEVLKQAIKKGAFRENDLSLRKLADNCGVSTHLASKAINDCAGQNFYDWVNEYRINDAKRLLIEKPGANVSPICYEVGFNTKSTFYKAFKKIEGQTPNEYRKRQAQG